MLCVAIYLLLFYFCMLESFSISFNSVNSINLTNAYSVENKIVYAKAKENCFLFKTSDVNNSSFHNVTFMVPESYFVIILSQINSYIYKVQYRSKIGYVMSDSIEVVDFIPVEPFLYDVQFDIPADVGTQIRSSPSVDTYSNVLSIIPSGTNGVNYIANIVGVVPTGGSSNIWYYCSYSPESDPTSVYEGYVYSEKTINLSNIEYNQEGVSLSTSDQENVDENSVHISPVLKYTLIAVMCLPILIIFVLLVINFKNQKLKSSKVNLETTNGYDFNDDKMVNKSKLKNDKFLRKIEELEGKPLISKKTKFSASLISPSKENLSPEFPVYEIVDDEDLL